jgi:hypothetical protein
VERGGRVDKRGRKRGGLKKVEGRRRNAGRWEDGSVGSVLDKF